MSMMGMQTFTLLMNRRFYNHFIVFHFRVGMPVYKVAFPEHIAHVDMGQIMKLFWVVKGMGKFRS